MSLAVLVIMLDKAIAIVALALAAPACHTTEAAERPGGTVVGQASVPEGLAQRQTGVITAVIRGIGDISDACADATSRQFVAQYTGRLTVEDDGQFRGELYSSGSPVTTPLGCVVKNLRVERVTQVNFAASIPGMTGGGVLSFQDLSAVDNDKLQAGNLDELHAELAFQPEQSDQ